MTIPKLDQEELKILILRHGTNSYISYDEIAHIHQWYKYFDWQFTKNCAYYQIRKEVLIELGIV